MKKLSKILGVGVVVAVIGLLVFGAVNRTLAKSLEPSAESEAQELAYYVEPALTVSTTSPETAAAVETQAAANEQVETVVYAGGLSQAEIDALSYMREEEKLARDVYLAMGRIWGLPVFNNIASSEQTHMDAILTVLNTYGLADPAATEEGKFNNPDLQALYDQLVQKGSLSETDAFMVGAAIEEIDILDLRESLTETTHADIQQVFTFLEGASGNHLSAFVKNMASRYGITYSPQYLTLEDYQTILASISTGNGAGGGYGTLNGNGAGGGQRGNVH